MIRRRCRRTGSNNNDAGEMVESVYEVSHWFEKRFRGQCRAPPAWKILRLVFLKKPDAKLETGIRGIRAVALMSVLAK